MCRLTVLKGCPLGGGREKPALLYTSELPPSGLTEQKSDKAPGRSEQAKGKGEVSPRAWNWEGKTLQILCHCHCHCYLAPVLWRWLDRTATVDQSQGGRALPPRNSCSPTSSSHPALSVALKSHSRRLVSGAKCAGKGSGAKLAHLGNWGQTCWAGMTL